MGGGVCRGGFSVDPKRGFGVHGKESAKDSYKIVHAGNKYGFGKKRPQTKGKLHVLDSRPGVPALNCWEGGVPCKI